MHDEDSLRQHGWEGGRRKELDGASADVDARV